MGNNKKTKPKKTCGCCINIIVIMFILVGVTYGTYVFAVDFIKGNVNNYEEKGIPEKEITIQIKEGESLKSISKKLKKAGIIESSFLFELKCKYKKIENNFRYGQFVLRTYMNFDQIADILTKSNDSDEYVTFLIREGATQREIAENLEKQNVVKADDFLNACDNHTFDFDFLDNVPKRKNRLEGYLFPDTYYFDVNSESDTVINKILSRFDEIYNDELKKATNENNLTIDEVVTIASIIEAEVRYPNERPTVASVIFNRLDVGMKLQMDSTVLYALGEKKDRVMETDTKLKSNYNTYYVEGLPAGPIGNPGADCIKAVLYPDKTNYLYYVVENNETGQHFFTNNYDEFLQAKQKYISNINGEN